MANVKEDAMTITQIPRRDHRLSRGKRLPRRGFLRSAAGAAVGLAIVSPRAAFGTEANSALRVGVIGCGGRGNFVSDKFRKATMARIIALADPFEENAERLRAQHAEASAKRFGGLDGYKGVLASDVDAVIITSPPCFHPEQAAAAVAAGKHVWLAKPVAVDVWGCQQIIAAGKQAEGKISFFVDFQTRNSPAFRESVDRVRRGDIGELVAGQVYYQASRLGVHADPADRSAAARLKNWVFDKRLSGDIIVEQNVHVLDLANWYIGAHPVRAFGTGGRKARVDVGDCWDHFLAVYWYPGDIQTDFSSGQYLKGFSDLCVRLYGKKGTVDAHYGGSIKITGETPWPGVDQDPTYQEPVLRNARDFEASIRDRKPLNNAQESAESTLTGILGRLAAYGERVVTWDEMLASGDRLDLGIAL